MKIEIQSLYEHSDCDQAGCSGGYEEGARIWVDGELVYELIPNPGCWDNNYYGEFGLLKIVLEKLGHEFEVVHDEE